MNAQTLTPVYPSREAFHNVTLSNVEKELVEASRAYNRACRRRSEFTEAQLAEMHERVRECRFEIGKRVTAVAAQAIVQDAMTGAELSVRTFDSAHENITKWSGGHYVTMQFPQFVYTDGKPRSASIEITLSDSIGATYTTRGDWHVVISCPSLSGDRHFRAKRHYKITGKGESVLSSGKVMQFVKELAREVFTTVKERHRVQVREQEIRDAAQRVQESGALSMIDNDYSQRNGVRKMESKTYTDDTRGDYVIATLEFMFNDINELRRMQQLMIDNGFAKAKQ